MTVTKFQSESPLAEDLTASRFDNRVSITPESLVANLESIILGIFIRDGLSSSDKNLLDSLFPKDERPLIVKDKNLLYPNGTLQNDFPFCLVFQLDQLNFCDLHNNFNELADRIESAWPSLATTSLKVKEAFENNAAAVLVNRSSGRIMAASTGFTKVTGITQENAAGKEYGAINRELTRFFSGRKLNFGNFNTDEVYLTLITISAPVGALRYQPEAMNIAYDTETDSHQIIDEPKAIGLHINRLNALLETNLQIAIAPETLDKLNSVITEMTDYCATDQQTKRQQLDSSNIKASMRLLIQSVLMSHRSLAGESARTEIVVFRNDNNDLQIKFDTPTVLEPNPQTKVNEWWQLVGNLSKRIDVRIGELQFTGSSIINRIYMTTEGSKADEKK